MPAWDLADRLTKALRESGLTVQGLADTLGVSRGTVGRWLNGHAKPTAGTLIAWAVTTGVDYHWLLGEDLDGSASAPAPAAVPGYANVPAQHVDKDGVCGWCAIRDSNPEPSD